MMDAYDYFDGDEPGFGTRRGAHLQMQGVVCSRECKEALYRQARVRMVMRLRGCTREEALRYVEGR